MNTELIAKLYEQSLIKEDREKYTLSALDEVKFAELIVQECCQALKPMLRDMVSRGQGVDLIKKHFGVE